MLLTLKRVPFIISNHKFIKPLFQRFNEGVIPIFMLHRIEDKERGVDGVPAKEIALFLEKLIEHDYLPMSMGELNEQIRLPNGVVTNRFLFTMDDGYLDQIEKGVPVFQEYGCPVSIAVITDFVAGRSWPWDAKVRYLFDVTEEQNLRIVLDGDTAHRFDLTSIDGKRSGMRYIREYFKTQPESRVEELIKLLGLKLRVLLPTSAPNGYLPCSWGDIQRLEGQGVNFIPHTKSHCILSNLTKDRAKEEIQGSIQELNKYINALPLFVYPNGRRNDCDEGHLQILRENGIKLAFTAENTYLSLNDLERNADESLLLPRIGMPRDHRAQEKIITGGDYVADRIRAGMLNDLFESTYGIKRRAVLNVFEWLTKRYLLTRSKKIEYSRIKRVIFVCVGNICRSPFAEIIALSHNLSFSVISAGLEASGMHSPDPTAKKIAKEFGYDMAHLCSTKFSSLELLDTDLLVVMELAHFNGVADITRKKSCQVTLLGAWSDFPMLSIDDPYGRSDARFRMIFSHIQVSTRNLLQSIQAK